MSLSVRGRAWIGTGWWNERRSGSRTDWELDRLEGAAGTITRRSQGEQEETVLKNVITGLLILIVGVFAFVGYNGYSAKRRVITDEVYGGSVPVAAGSSSGSTESPALAAGLQGSHRFPPPGEVLAHSDGALSSDSLPPQPTEGEKFGAGGHFQLYRQGDITWRLNVDTGQSCILLATDEEWHKERVYRSGCKGARGGESSPPPSAAK